MRKVVFTGLITLDGYVAGPGGDLSGMPFDESFSPYNAERLRAADTLLLGATSYRSFVQYWPPVADDEAQPPLEREISRLNGAMEKVVVSDSVSTEDTGAWADTTRIVKRGDALDVVGELRAGEGGDILMFGSTVLLNHLLANGLVDELHLMVGNKVLGGGVPAFTVGTDRLELVEVRQLEGSQNSLLRYAVPAA